MLKQLLRLIGQQHCYENALFDLSLPAVHLLAVATAHQ
jgi:hypothetical protein